MRILIAPDKFKGSLGAEEVAERIRAGVRSALPTAEIEMLPLADGGEGHGGDDSPRSRDEWVSCAAHDALGREIHTRYAWMAAVCPCRPEMSAAAGLQLLRPNERNPIRRLHRSVWAKCCFHAVARGATGSHHRPRRKRNTNDGGFGLARALGFRSSAVTIASSPGRSPPCSSSRSIERPDDLSLRAIIAACDGNQSPSRSARRDADLRRAKGPRRSNSRSSSAPWRASRKLRREHFTAITATYQGPVPRAASASGLLTLRRDGAIGVRGGGRTRSICALKSSAPTSSSPAKENSIARRLLEKLQPVWRRWRERWEEAGPSRLLGQSSARIRVCRALFNGRHDT